MDMISYTLSNMFRDNASVLMALLVFLATGTMAFSAMAFARVRGAVKRRTARIMDDEGAAKSTRSLRYSSLKAVTQLIEYTTKHYSTERRQHEGAAPAADPGRHLRFARRRLLLHRAHRAGGRPRRRLVRVRCRW